MAEQSLKDKTITGTFWSVADTFLAQGVSFLVGIVLARLLSPEEYGLIGIVTIFTTILMGVVDSGFRSSLIRKRDVTDEDYSTLFYFNLAVSFLVFALLFVGAPWIAVFFNRPELTSLVRIMGVILIIQALSIVQDTILTKRIDFKTKTKASVTSAVVSGALGIGMAFSGYGVWALVAQQLSRQLIYSILFWILNKWSPQVKFSLDSLKYMWGFGWKLLVSGLLDNIWKQMYQVVVGKFYSPTDLGQYTRAEQYAGLFSSNLTSVVQRVTYPVLAEVQNNKTRMVSGYRKIIKTTMFLTAVLMISMGAVAEPLIYCLIGPQWHTAASFLPLICINMSLYPLHAINLNMLQVQGRTDVFLYLEIVKKVIAIIPIVVGVFISIYWMLIVGVVVGIVGFFLNSYYTGKNLEYSSWMQLKDVAPSFGIAFLVGFSVYFLKYLPLSYWYVLPLQLILGGIVLVSSCEIVKLPEYIEVKGIIMGYCHSLRIKYKKCNNY